jgi:transcription initiation factor IIE alpha subunit
MCKRNTNIPLLKFKCNNKDCQFECLVNQHNNTLTAYNKDFATLLEWKCPECGEDLRYAKTNAKFNFSLTKEDKGDVMENEVD